MGFCAATVSTKTIAEDAQLNRDGGQVWFSSSHSGFQVEQTKTQRHHLDSFMKFGEIRMFWSRLNNYSKILVAVVQCILQPLKLISALGSVNIPFVLKHQCVPKCSVCDIFHLPFVFHSGDGDDDEEGREERLPSCYDYVMHFLTVFWKVLFACVPPTEYWNGWACFLVSISIIGFLTAIIGDLASHFGCTVGLRDTVTAVVFVALGTSVPGLWKALILTVRDCR